MYHPVAASWAEVMGRPHAVTEEVLDAVKKEQTISPIG
jgi:hypothetical protein